MNQVKQTLGGFFKLEAVNPSTGTRRVLADWFPNLITDAGLNWLGSGSMWSHAMVGAGSTVPAVGDNQLALHVASTSTQQSSTTTFSTTPGNIYAARTRTYRFGVGAAAGNLTEVGMSWSSSPSGTLFCRSLIKDGNGDPTTITVLAGEALDVTYQLRVYPPQTDVTFNVTIAGVTHACTLRAAQISTANAWADRVGERVEYSGIEGWHHGSDGPLGPITGYGSGTIVGLGSASQFPYANNSYTRGARQTCGLNTGNLANGIRSVYFAAGGAGAYQCQFDPPIQKTATKVLTLDWSVSWARRP